MPNKDVLMPSLQETLYSGMIGEGELVYQFEDKFCQFLGIENGIAMSSGTAALHCSLYLSGVKPGDEVITTSMTAEPTNLSILHIGAKPVFADVDEFSGNISPESIESKINEKTKAILVVHYAGVPVRLNEIMTLAKKYNLKVIEDCAHALGAQYDGMSVGAIGDFSIFSFQAIKHMTTIDGGFLVMKDPEHISRAKKFRWFGMEKGVDRTIMDIDHIGYKYNMNNVTATIGIAQLSGISKKIDEFKKNGQFFDRNISRITGLDIVRFEPISEPSYWLYTILSDDSENVFRKMESIGVQASKLHRPNHYHSIFKHNNLSLPNLDMYYKRMIHIPCGWWLAEEKREEIVKTLKQG